MSENTIGKKSLDWVDKRFPVIDLFERHLSKYYSPSNINIWYLFGFLLLIVLVMQILTGLWLMMNYTNTAEGAFSSIEYIMRDVDYGWLIRYMHAGGASAFFALIYLHMFRGMMYGSYQKPRELIWVGGWFVYVLLCAEGFTGYVLPWGQMSFWAAQVIISLVGSIPYFGEDLAIWIRGVDKRFPVIDLFERHLSKYYSPSNINIWYLFGFLLLIVLVMQILTGLWLMMNYTNTAEGAFSSIEYIMRDVDYGWLIRYMHAGGASAFFALIYLHMFRGMMYGSYQKPRELIWVGGWFVYVLLCAEGFTGYVLPWGQMSFWAAQVIISLVGSIPYFGEDLAIWIRGDYIVSGITLSRLFAFHVVLLPILIIAVVFFHILALHEIGSNNPDGIDVKKHTDQDGVPLDAKPFFPYDITHDFYALGVFLLIFCTVIFFFPEGGGYIIEYVNYEPANPLSTPAHIVPSWYYTPFYAMLRAIDFPLFGLTAKFLGFVVMAAGIAIFAALPWLDRSPVKSIKYKGIFSKVFLAGFVISFFVLAYLGSVPPTETKNMLAKVFTFLYFAYFLLMPFYTRFEKCKPVPERVGDTA